MKKLPHVLLLSALTLTGCGKKEPAPPPALLDLNPTTQATETLPDPTEETVELSYAAYQVTYTYLEDQGQEFYTFQGIGPDGAVVWTRESAHLDCAQVQRVSPIGTADGAFFYNEDGTVIALDVKSGEILWENSDFGGNFSTPQAAMVDPDGFLYLCGYFGPDLFVLDLEGNTVKKIDSLNPDYFWAFQVQREGEELVISLEGDGASSGETHIQTVPMDWLPQPQG